MAWARVHLQCSSNGFFMLKPPSGRWVPVIIASTSLAFLKGNPSFVEVVSNAPSSKSVSSERSELSSVTAISKLSRAAALSLLGIKKDNNLDPDHRLSGIGLFKDPL